MLSIKWKKTVHCPWIKDSYNRVEAERVMPKLKFVKRAEVIYRNIVCIMKDTVKKTLRLNGTLNSHLARISIWYLDSPDHNKQTCYMQCSRALQQ